MASPLGNPNVFLHLMNWFTGKKEDQCTEIKAKILNLVEQSDEPFIIWNCIHIQLAHQALEELVQEKKIQSFRRNGERFNIYRL